MFSGVMTLASSWRNLVFGIMVFLLLAAARSEEFTSGHATEKVISDLTDSIAQSMGWSPEEVRVSNMDSLETMFGQATLYEFDLQVGSVVVPLKLSDDVKSWKVVERYTREAGDSENGLVKEGQDFARALAPFQLAGPLELWIHDADHMRLYVPHDVEAGVLKKVILADGAVVTVKGARELSLREPIQLPLPLRSSTSEDGNLASNLIEFATELRQVSSDQGNPLSLRIVGATSLAASSVNEPDSTANKLKVKRLSPSSVELRSRQEQQTPTPLSFEAATNSLSPNDMWMWPLPSLNGSDPKIRGIEQILQSFLGTIAPKKGSIKLLKAKAAAATFIKIQFEIEKKVGDVFSSETWPEWRTKPSVITLQFELTGKVEGDKILPLSVQQMEPVNIIETSSPNLLTGNVTFSRTPVTYPPPYPFTL